MKNDIKSLFKVEVDQYRQNTLGYKRVVNQKPI